MSASDATFSLRQVQKLVGLGRPFIELLMTQQVLSPRRGEDGAPLFGWQDVVVLRTAKALRESRVPPSKIARALRQVAESLRGSAHVASVRMHARGAAIEVRDGETRRDALSGQLLLPLEENDAASTVLDTRQAAPTAAPEQAASSNATSRPSDHARDWFEQGLRLEASDAAAAEAAYRRAIRDDPCLGEAYVNLGAMLCEGQRCHEAVSLYEQALNHCGDTPLIHFNRATALEDVGQPEAAIEAYSRALALDPGLADAHFNLGVLMERLGDERASLRHFSAYRRLHREG